MKKKKTKIQKDEMKHIPFSKKNVNYARQEAYVFSLILIVMVWCGKDVTAISILLSLAWGGYKSLQCFYLWMCKHEHIEEMKQKRLSNNLDTSDLDFEIENLNNEDFNMDNYVG